MSNTVIIVGAGQAGLQTAVSLRQGGFEGRVVLLGRESHLPYQRPPLSKQVLKGEFDAERCTLRGADFLAQHDIDFRPESDVTQLNTADRQVSLQDGRVVPLSRRVTDDAIADTSFLRQLMGSLGNFDAAGAIAGSAMG